MSLHEYPQRYEKPNNPQPLVKVTTPADSPAGTLVSNLILNLTKDKTAIVAVQFPSGQYLAIIEMTVHGNPPADSRLPALSVSYTYNGANGTDSYKVEGVTSQGSDVADEFNVTQSVRFTSNGQRAVIAGTTGGLYTGTWSYDAEISIYRVQ